MDEILKRDQNHVTVLAGVTNDSDKDITMLRVDPITKKLLVSASISGEVVTTINGLSGAVTLAAGSNITITPSGQILTIASTGGGGSPGGSPGDIQYNNSGAFGGITLVPIANAGNGLSGVQTNVATSGNIAALSPTTSFLNMTNNGGSVIQGMVSNGTNQRVTIRASTGGGNSVVIIRNENASATAANRFALESSTDLTLTNTQEAVFLFNTSTSRWNLNQIRNSIAVDGGNNLYSIISGTPAASGTQNVIFGFGAIGNNAYIASGGVIIGANAAKFASGSGPGSNVIIGLNAVGTGVLTGGSNVILGVSSAANLTSGANNAVILGGNVLTTGASNSFYGQNSGNNTTTGNYNVAMGLNAGTIHATGDYNISIGQASGSLSATNLSNTITLGQQSRVTSSNQANIGSASVPLYVGINNSDPQYRLDVVGDINTNSGYRLNGLPFSPWLTLGNAATVPSTNFIGTTDYVDFVTRTDDVETSRTTADGLTGFQNVAPTAIVHAGALAASVPTVPTGTPPYSILLSSGGYAFGSASSRAYQVYGSKIIDGVTIYSSGVNTLTFFEEPSTDFDATSFTANSTPSGGGGYDPNVDPPPMYQIWALYFGSTAQSIGTVTVTTDSGTWIDTSQNQNVNVSWIAPIGQVPDAYFIARNATDSQIVTGSLSLLDGNTGWSGAATPGFPNISYEVDVSWPLVSGATNYRILNITDGTFIDDATGNVIDDSSWSSGSTVTPTSAFYKSFQADGLAQLVAATTDFATLNVPAGTAPTSPNDGDMWRIGAVLYLQDGATTKSITFT